MARSINPELMLLDCNCASCTRTSRLPGDLVITSSICCGVNCCAKAAEGSSAIVMARMCFT